MKITIVMGYYLPVPPDAGGSAEKAWYLLAKEFMSRGHEVTVISRSWTGWPDNEISEGIRYRRLPGTDQQSRAMAHWWCDFKWSIKTFLALPKADVTIVNCTCLSIFLGWIRRSAGGLVLMPARIPRGQCRFYRRVDSLLAASSAVRAEIIRENPKLSDRIQIVGQPIDWGTLSKSRGTTRVEVPLIAYIGRIHREKGLDLLVGAIETLARREGLPPFRVLLCGPRDKAQGGSGETYATSLERRLARVLPRERFAMRPLSASQERRYSVLREIDVFCYPTTAKRSEVFGQTVAEAMAAGAVPVVSALPCFDDYISSGNNGERFDHTAPDAAERLAIILEDLLRDSAKRIRLSEAARSSVYRYDYPLFASRLLADFATIALAR